MGLKAWALRRVMGRLRITEDILRHASTFQRLGETVEVELPGELLPVGARTVFRALRTRAAAQIGVDWIWPYWLDAHLLPPFPPPSAAAPGSGRPAPTPSSTLVRRRSSRAATSPC